MNGRIYDPELGRMLSPDPYVQVPEYSQNFNRYSYVLNNPLNKTDPTGYSWVSKAFHKIGSWVKENWRTVATIVLASALMLTGAGAFIFGFMYGLAGGTAAGIAAMSTFTLNMAVGATIGGITGAIGAALSGGNLGDVLRGAAVGAVQGAISSGPLHYLEGAKGMQLAHIAGHGVTGGAANAAMGGKFQDGFLSAAASAAAVHTGLTSTAQGSTGEAIGMAGRTAASAIIGGTASALGGGKFANGAYTSAFQHLLNGEMIKALNNTPEQGEVLEDGSPQQHLFGESAPIGEMGKGGKAFLYAYWYNHRNGSNMLEGILGIFDENGVLQGTWRDNSGGYGKGPIPSNMRKGWSAYKHLQISELEGGNLWKSLTGTKNGSGYTRDNYSFKFWIGTEVSTDRSAILFHPDGGAKGTEGCMGIDHGRVGCKNFHDRFMKYSKNGIRLYVE